MNILKFFLIPLLALVWTLPLWSKTNEVPLDQLKPTREQRQATLIALKVINQHHYKRHHLDDDMSDAILERYLDMLDPNRSFFTVKDIERFKKYENTLDDALIHADLEPAFKIFKQFRKRVDERIAYALSQLDKKFDFTRNEQYRFDRSEAQWPRNKNEQNEIWRKRVKNDILALRLTNKDKKDIKQTLKKRYEGIRRRTHQLASEDVFQSFLNSYTLSLEPHTAYMSPRVSENFDISMRLSLEGIGAVLRTDNEYTLVQRIIPGGPAYQSEKLHAGDRIVGVGQNRRGEIVDVIGWRLQDVVELIRGPKGSVVRLRILPEGDGPTSVLTLTRNKIKLEDQAAKSSIIEGLDGMGSLRIGVIELPAFYRDFRGHSRGVKDYRSTTRDVRRLLAELEKKNVDGILIDLRQNGGGSLIEATGLTGLFIPEGPVVQIKNAAGNIEIEQDPDPSLIYKGPLAVLVDSSSASASEIFAGAIQDYKRGIIVGEPTFGKGTVQTLVDLNRYIKNGDNKLGRLRLTMAQFFRINGGSTQFKGVVPDIIFPSASKPNDLGERSLENALPWSRIDAADYTPTNLANIALYREQHKQRIANDPGFRYLTEEALLLQEIRDLDMVTLVEKQRKLEWDNREKQRKEMKKRYRVAMGLPPLPENSDEKKEKHEGNGLYDEDDDHSKKIMLNEAAKILADYIIGRPETIIVKRENPLESIGN